MVSAQEFTALKLELSVRAKNGIDFIVAASLIWAVIALVWMLPNSPARNSLFTFFAGGAMLPLAWLLSKAFRTTWKLPHNPLQPLGLLLNFAQLFYFPFLILIYSKYPQYFVMTYGIITGAHFFPYAWFYQAKPYAFMAGVIPVGCLLIGTRVSTDHLYWVPVFVAGSMLCLLGLLLLSYRQNREAYARLMLQPA